MAKTYIVRLAPEERLALETMIKKGRAAAYKIRHANILLKADAEAGWTDMRIADAFGCHYRTVENVRKRFVLEGLATALNRKKQCRPSVEPKLDGEKEAKLIAVACSAPPAGRRRWALRLLADRLVELDIVDTISHETVRQAMKKTRAAKLAG
ncbi:MAG: helix-turn-helix domain-containing protein [Planctomycetota bacterium]|jgi:transposase